MRSYSSLRKLLSGLSIISGTAFFFPNEDNSNPQQKKFNISKPPSSSSFKWDHNWDRRDPKSLVKPATIKNEADRDRYDKEVDKKTAKVVRHIILIRHGQYNMKPKADADRILTRLGREQAEVTGRRLQQLGLPYTLLVHSTMARAEESASIIKKSLGSIEVQRDSLLNEGAPIQPEPHSRWSPELKFHNDGPRIEAAFRKYFHRADCWQKEETYTILVCHANVIRYFVCRALQFPPEGWLRISLNHASITWISIYPNGGVALRTLGDTGHMLPNLISSS